LHVAVPSLPGGRAAACAAAVAHDDVNHGTAQLIIDFYLPHLQYWANDKSSTKKWAAAYIFLYGWRSVAPQLALHTLNSRGNTLAGNRYSGRCLRGNWLRGNLDQGCGSGAAIIISLSTIAHLSMRPKVPLTIEQVARIKVRDIETSSSSQQSIAMRNPCARQSTSTVTPIFAF
jgi:hypothetical protein